MSDINETLNYFTSSAFIISLCAILITAILLKAIKKYLIKKVAYTSKDKQHQNTFIGVIFNLLQYFVVIICAVVVLHAHGVNVTSIVAGLGIIATLVGLALQDTMKDIISGINIYNNNFYKVGDLVKYNGEICDVKYFSARVTKFQSIFTSNTFTVCNSQISAIEKIKDITTIKVTFDMTDDKKLINKIFLDAKKAVENEPYVKSIDYFGIVDIDERGAVYAAVITIPGHKAMGVKLKFLDKIHDGCHKYKVYPVSDLTLIEKRQKQNQSVR